MLENPRALLPWKSRRDIVAFNGIRNFVESQDTKPTILVVGGVDFGIMAINVIRTFPTIVDVVIEDSVARNVAKAICVMNGLSQKHISGFHPTQIIPPHSRGREFNVVFYDSFFLPTNFSSTPEAPLKLREANAKIQSVWTNNFGRAPNPPNPVEFDRLKLYRLC